MINKILILTLNRADKPDINVNYCTACGQSGKNKIKHLKTCIIREGALYDNKKTDKVV